MLNLNNTQFFVLLAIGGAAAYWFMTTPLGEALETAGEAVTDLYSTDPENIWYSGINDAGAAVSGNDNFSLGVLAWEFLNQDKVRAGL